MRYRREYGVFYEFLMSFYDLHANEKSYFWQAKKITDGTGTELESFVDLVGGISSGEASLWEAGALAGRFQNRSREFSMALDRLGADDESSMMPLFRSSIVRQAMRESAQIQSLAVLGGGAECEVPLFDNGLVPSPDGMFWSVPGSRQA